MTTIAKAVEIAASSKEAAVRRLAIEYKKLQREREDLELRSAGYDNFFKFYAQAVELPGEPCPEPSMDPVTRGGDDLIEQVKTILREYGEPMKVQAIYDAFVASHGPSINANAFRVRLYKHRRSPKVPYGVPYDKENDVYFAEANGKGNSEDDAEQS